ncbi:hypothetical protein [Paenibacillus piri]|uniref:VCBS repeat-containing protein n=1 Tax=Paenibacillus piri TaxID=2547395 RepID=A0A4R5KND0_9BACL|nr:hypothetical protein [Paenibacillus piri]TDF97169.1 hypothetical protein E1757_15160 [Paenibacillus piri]
MLSRPLKAGIIISVIWLTGGCGMPAAPIDLIKPPVSHESVPKDSFHTALQALLPEGARLLIPRQGDKFQAVSFGDVDGDGVDEAVVVYEESSRPEKSLRASVLKQHDAAWRIVGDAKGIGYGIDYVRVADDNGDGISEIMLGWSLGAGGTGMDTYEWKNNVLTLTGKKGYGSPPDGDAVRNQSTQ